MKAQALIGIILIAAGVLILIYQGFTYTHREQVAKIGPLEISGEKHETVPISPIIGAVCIVGGIVVMATAGRKS